MQFEQAVLPHLAGEEFSNGLAIRIRPQASPNRDRLELLETMVKGKNVIHIGCVDHVPLIEKKREQDTWLHERLCRSATRCVGLDINEQGIRMLIDELKFDDVFHFDMLNDEPEMLQGTQWDYMILGEILEHVDDPVAFLGKIREKYSGLVNSLIVTVPNALRLPNFFYAIFGKEVINTDHRYWFTPFTLAKVGASADLKVQSFDYALNFPVKIKGPVTLARAMILRSFPQLRDTIVMELALS